MKIKKNIKIFDDEDVDIHGRNCVFYYTTSIKKYTLEGMYGVNGKELEEGGFEIVHKHHYILGRYDEKSNCIVDLLTKEEINIENIELKQVKIVDAGLLIKNYLMDINKINVDKS